MSDEERERSVSLCVKSSARARVCEDFFVTFLRRFFFFFFLLLSYLALLAPIVAISVISKRFEDYSLEKKWNLVVASGFFLGTSQGIVWTMSILMAVDVSGPLRKGFASGMCETVGYCSVALFAIFYALREETLTTCKWEEEYRAESMRTEACIRVNPSGACGNSDQWKEECSGMCNCEGYIKGPFSSCILFAAIGLFVLLIFGRETGVLIKKSTANNRDDIVRRRTNIVQAQELNDSFQSIEGEEEDTSFEDQEASFLQQTRVRDGGGGGNSSSHNHHLNQHNIQQNEQEEVQYSFVNTFMYTLTNRNLRLVAFAAFCCNVETGLAWGLFPIWMRDELGLTGDQRDLFSGLYSFSKGIAQFYFGQQSDKNTRATPIRWGLIGGGLSLILASYGNIAGSTYPGILYFGAITLGLSTGAVYPVLAPAALDHSRNAQEQAATLGSNRFWRDLGYVMGTPLSFLADRATPRVSFHLAGITMIIVGWYFGYRFEEGDIKIQSEEEETVRAVIVSDSVTHREEEPSEFDNVESSYKP